MALVRAIRAYCRLSNKLEVETRVGPREKGEHTPEVGLTIQMREAESRTSSQEGKEEALALSRREHILHLLWVVVAEKGWGRGGQTAGLL